jgi:diguanylate cyclase (GGDEF)-like protein
MPAAGPPSFIREGSIVLDRLTHIDLFSIRRGNAFLLGCAMFVAVVALDYSTTYELSLTPFYLFIVILVGWNCGWKPGLVFAMASFAAPVLIGDFSGYLYSEPLYFYVDNANRLISYLVALGLTSQLKAQHEREKQSARRDHLTGLANPKGFYEALSIEIARHRRQRIPLAVAYFDCDNFKLVNDRFGHNEGDRLLEGIGRVLKENLRKTDVIGRLGGDEFAVVLTNTDQRSAVEAVGKLRRELDTLMREYHWPVTFSVGIGIFSRVPESEDTVIRFTDNLMYRVKEAGKNDILSEEFAPEPI